MIGVAAVGFAATLTSCSKAGDLYDEGRVEKEKEQAIVNSYEKAFEAAFGKVGANVDWGFSSKSSSTRAFTRAVGTYKDYKGDIRPVNVTFPSDAPSSKFDPDLTGIPSYEDFLKSKGNENWTPTEFNVPAVVYIDHVRNVKMTDGNSKLYIKAGEYDFTDEEFNLAAGIEVYLLPGAILTLNNTAASTAKFTLYIASTAKLIANGQNGYRADVSAQVYNHGTIECSRFEVNGTSFLYNVGTLTSTGDVYIANSTSRIVNDGTIEAASTNVEGSGALQNNAEWTVSGNTIVSCTNGGWVNNGHWTTRNYGYTAGSENVINNCFLEVTNEFDMNISSSNSAHSFKIDTGGGVLTKYFNGGKVITDANSVSGPYRIVMGQASVFKVTETATLDGGNKGWGFFGPSEGQYAVFQAKDVRRGREHSQGMVTYGGNLYVSAETHFTNDDQWNPSIYYDSPFTLANIYASGDDANFSTGKPNITIQETPCNPGFSGKDPLYRVIAEDLTADQAGDFDFNDVVFDVVKYEGGKTTLRLQACGGTLKLKIGSTNGEGGKEVHELYGDNEPDATTGKYKMWNTGTGNVHDPVDFTIDGQYDTPERLLNLRIEVFKENKWMLLEAKRGVAACKILVDDRFGIVPERQSIANKYGNFTTYVQGNWKDENEQFWWIQTGN